jgi:molybdate transport system substrate-binding protein
MPRKQRRLRRWIVSIVVSLALCGSDLRAESIPIIAAASNLRFALAEVAEKFERESGSKLRFVFGSSGNFYSQLLQGAPFHLFMSADESFVVKLAAAKKTVDRGRVYAIGRIGIIVPHGSAVKADVGLKDLALAVADGRLRKFAIANPEHAPYGARTKQALLHVGLWSGLQEKLVLGENISQAAQFATSGSTEGGVIALSLAKAPVFAHVGEFALIPDYWHEPLRQRMVLLKGAPASVRAFYDYLGSANAQEIMVRYGFSMPAA